MAQSRLAELPAAQHRATPGAAARGRTRPRPRPGLVLGLVLVGAAAIAAIGAPWLVPYPPLRQHLDWRLVGPGATFWLGTDELGRDILSRLIFGSRISLAVALGSTSLALVLGCGRVSGPGWPALGWSRSSCAVSTCYWRSPPRCSRWS